MYIARESIIVHLLIGYDKKLLLFLPNGGKQVIDA